MLDKKKTNEYIDKVGVYFDRLPAISKGSRSAMVSVLPWLVLVFGILGVAVSMVGIGIFTIFEPIAQVAGIRGAGQNFFFVLLSLISSILLLSSFQGVQRKKEYGWKRVYYSEAVSLLNDIVTFSLGGILLSLIGFFILYQIRSYYK